MTFSQQQENQPFTVTVTALPGGNVALLSVTYKPSDATVQQPTVSKTCLLNVIVDNSASMGDSTRAALRQIVRPLLTREWLCTKEPVIVTVFDDKAEACEISTVAAFDHMVANLPRQGCTNITLGIKTAMAALQRRVMLAAPGAKASGSDLHVVTIMLTDGEHNRGDAVSVSNTQAMRASLEDACGPLHHTFIAFCLTDKSDAAASMIAKEIFETVKIETLPNVFFAPAPSDMEAGLRAMLVACDDEFGSTSSVTCRFELPSATCGDFISTGNGALTTRMKPFQVEPCIVTMGSTPLTHVVINGVSVAVSAPAAGAAKDLPIPEAIAAVRDSLRPLARQAVAFNVEAIERRLGTLEALIASIDAIVVAENLTGKACPPESGSAASDTASMMPRTPAERRALLKSVVHSRHSLRELRNELAALRVRSRSNSESITLLTGNTRKFAHIASKRSKTEARTPEQVLEDTLIAGERMAVLLGDDIAAAAATGHDVDPSNPEDAIVPVSIITLQTNAELLRQWQDDVDINGTATWKASQTTDEAIMDILSSYGMAAYPVQLITSDATQVDLMQLRVKRLCAQVADSASMMMSWRINAPIKFADGQTYTELLLLVDPALPRASHYAMTKSMLAQHLLSAMISKDLYMYLPPMHASMHTHSFMTAVNTAIALGDAKGEVAVESFLRLALHIVYSAHKLWQAGDIFDDMGNFDRWLKEGKSVTRSQHDVVYHVAALSLKFALSSVDVRLHDDRAALLMQMNESLARRLGAAHSAYSCGAAFAQVLFGVDASDAPAPLPDDEEEPHEAAVRDACLKALPSASLMQGTRDGLAALAKANGGDAPVSVRAFVESEFLPLYRMHIFSLALHEELQSSGCTMMEYPALVEAHAGIPVTLVNSVRERLAAFGTDADSMWQWLGCTKEREVVALCAASVMQGCLYPDTQTRSGIVNDHDVSDPSEQRAMIGQLYYIHYDNAVTAKRVRKRQTIGEVSACQASTVDVDTFAAMLGQHTHGLSKNSFWGMVRGLRKDPDPTRRNAKSQQFLALSNVPFGVKYGRHTS